MPPISFQGTTTMVKNLDITPPVLPANNLKYETECRDILAPHLDELLDRAEVAGWQRKQAAMAIMYLAAKRTK